MDEQESKKNRSDDSFGANDSTNKKLIIRECLTESFSNIDDITEFCFIYFNSVHKDIDGYRHKRIVRLIMEYCYANAQIGYLWECIKKEKENQYKIYYPKGL